MKPWMDVNESFVRRVWRNLRWRIARRLDTRHRAQLQQLHQRHRGERCVIIGNGPSLKQTDLSRLAGEMTFATNRFYLLHETLTWQPDYYVAVNKYVVRQFAADLCELPVRRLFVPWYVYGLIPPRPHMTWLHARHGLAFARCVTSGLWTGPTVTYVALQLAFHMGFETVYLVGVDHHYPDAEGQPHQLVTAGRADCNHFDPAYFQPGVRWQLPDLAASEDAYRLAQQAYSQAGRTIYDATVNGRLTIFPKRAFERVF
jgi:hypothetical protein